MKKIVFILIVILFTFLTFPTYAEEDRPSQWAVELVDEAKEYNILGERLFTNYKTEITRLDFAYLAVMIYENYTGSLITIGDVSFTDTKDIYALKAKTVGIVSGYPEGDFRPTHSISREEIATLLVNTYKAIGFDLTKERNDLFIDNSTIANWAREAVYIVKKEGVVEGIGNDLFDPNGTATREQALIMFVKTLSRFTVDRVKNESIPARVVLSIGEDPTTSIGLSWESDLKYISDKLRIAKKEDDSLDLLNYSEYTIKSKIVRFYDGRVSKRSYQIRLKYLEEDTDYIYSVGSEGNWTTPKTFRTLSSTEDLTLSFLGDIQGYKQKQYDELRVVYEQLLAYSGGVDISMFAGDIVDHPAYYAEWKFLDNSLGDYLASDFVVTAIGNHDNIDEGVIFSNTFIAPKNGLEWLENRNYYFEIGELIVAVIDSESSRYYANQKEWLIELMKNHQDKLKIVLMHRSAYPMKYNDIKVRNWVETFDEADIDLVLSGHDHIYNRTTMKNDERVSLDEGVTYLIGGSGSGSKYYKEETIEGGRYWRDVVFDDDYPVFSIINIRDGVISVDVYAIKEGEVILIDSFKKK